jgi:hypothetical protein
MNPLSFLTNGLNCLFAILIASTISLLGGIYLGHSYEKNYYEAKISKDELARKQNYDKALSDQQAKNNLAVSQLFKLIQEEQNKNANYQSQVKAIYTNSSFGMGGNSCYVSYGFIRLFNASARGTESTPSSTDYLRSPVDLASVLSTIVENHGKYRQVANQIEAIKEANE